MSHDLAFYLAAAQDFGEQHALRLTPRPPTPVIPVAVESEGT